MCKRLYLRVRRRALTGLLLFPSLRRIAFGPDPVAAPATATPPTPASAFAFALLAARLAVARAPVGRALVLVLTPDRLDLVIGVIDVGWLVIHGRGGQLRTVARALAPARGRWA